MDTMVISPDSTIEKQKNQHTHNFERTAPQVRSFLFGSFNYAPRANHRLRHKSKKTGPALLQKGETSSSRSSIKYRKGLSLNIFLRLLQVIVWVKSKELQILRPWRNLYFGYVSG